MQDFVDSKTKIRRLSQNIVNRNERRASMAKSVLRTVIVIVVTGLVSLLGCGCATTPVKPVVVSVGPAGFAGTVRIAVMGDSECGNQKEFIKRQVVELLEAHKVPTPSVTSVHIKIGSSLCDGVQGTASEFNILELGGRNITEAEVSVSWQIIERPAFKRAQHLLALMRPTP